MTNYNLALAGTIAFTAYDGNTALQTAASNYSNTVTMSQESVDRPNDPFTLSLPAYYIEVDVDLNSFVTGTQSTNNTDDDNLDDVFGIKGFSIDSSAADVRATGYWEFKQKAGDAAADTTKIAQAATITFEADSSDSDITVTGTKGDGTPGSANTVLLVNYNVASSTGQITVGVTGLVHNDSGNGTITTTIVDNLQKQQFWKATQDDIDDLDNNPLSSNNVIYPEMGQTGENWGANNNINTTGTAPTKGDGQLITGLGDDSISVPASSFYTNDAFHTDFSGDLVGELVANQASVGSKVNYLQVVNSFSFEVNASNVESDGDPNTTPDARHNQLSEFARYKIANGDSEYDANNAEAGVRSGSDVNTQLVSKMPSAGALPATGFPLFNHGDSIIVCEEVVDAEGQELNTGLELQDGGTTGATAAKSTVSVLVPSALTTAPNAPADAITSSQENDVLGTEGEPLFSANVGIVLKQVANWTLQNGTYQLPVGQSAWIYDANAASGTIWAVPVEA